MTDADPRWPALPLEAWEPTRATLHMWMQIVGKVRLALSPYLNHWWQVPLYVSPRGLTTSPIPAGGESFEMVFDFLAHALRIEKSDGGTKAIPLAPRPVADFYKEVMAALDSLGIAVRIWTMPVEIAAPIPFDQDRTHAVYDPEYARRFWRILLSVDAVLREFRGRFLLRDLAGERRGGEPAPDARQGEGRALYRLRGA